MKSYSKEELKALAKESSILDVIYRMGFTIVQTGSTYTTKEMDSLRVFPKTNSYFRFSQNRGGDTLDFLTKECEMASKDAIAFLAHESLSGTVMKQAANRKMEIEPKEFILPQKANNSIKVFQYLTEVRCINPDLVEMLEYEKFLYQDIRGNAVFVGYDGDKPAYAALRGTDPNRTFKGEVTGSRKAIGYSYHMTDAKSIVVCEAPIDMLSVMTMTIENEQFGKFSYLSLGGLSMGALERVLDEYPGKYSHVFSCLDADKKGVAGYEKLRLLTHEKNLKLTNMSVLYKTQKDVNGYLQYKVKEQGLIKETTKSLEDEREIGVSL